jgi:hypothetical protein
MIKIVKNGYKIYQTQKYVNMQNDNLDKSIIDSVNEIVKKNKQGDDLAAKILSWLDAVHSGKESIENKNAYMTRVEVLLDATKVDINGK